MDDDQLHAEELQMQNHDFRQQYRGLSIACFFLGGAVAPLVWYYMRGVTNGPYNLPDEISVGW